MFCENVRADQDQHDTAGKCGLVFVFHAESVADQNAAKTDKEGGDADDRHRRPYRYRTAQNGGQRDACGECINACCNGHDKQPYNRESFFFAAFAIVIPVEDHVNDHFAANDEQE